MSFNVNGNDGNKFVRIYNDVRAIQISRSCTDLARNLIINCFEKSAMEGPVPQAVPQRAKSRKKRSFVWRYFNEHTSSPRPHGRVVVCQVDGCLDLDSKSLISQPPE